MEVIEKVKEIEKDHNKEYASKNLAGTALGFGIGGAALGLYALSRNKGFGLFGNGYSMPENVNINANMGTNGTSPTAFQAWEKECEDNLKLQADLYNLALNNQYQRFSDRQTLNGELFNVWKGQVDSNFGLYKSTRDSFDAVNKRITEDSFALYKNQRDNFDTLSSRISALETKQAVADAVEPWRAKVLDMRINGVAATSQAGINLEAERRCCADSKIVNYVNSTFVPQMIVDFTTGTTTHAEETYNPLCSCCKPCGNI